MVGAGGIGCELLKTLVLSGFENIEMIDLDTIDVSNLNRQFLFRRKHVGQSKAFVARSSALKFRPGTSIEAHHGNVKDDKFNIEFVKGFDVVLNGLDNLEARKHVNRLCLAADIPLVESGTTGYLGQVTVHEGKNINACFECSPKPTPKSHPICTLRDTPEKPVHCVAYATDLLFPKLFNSNRDLTSDLDEEDARDARAFARDAENGESFATFATRVYDFVFRTKIESLLLKEEMWEKRSRPNPLPAFRDVVKGESADDVAAGADATLRKPSASEAVGVADAQKVMTVEQAARVFVSSVARIMTRDKEAAAKREDGVCGTDAFDKDDALAVDFVAAVSTLRSANYGIPPQSPFDVKGVAGNIVHAVATTNAIVGGLIVLEAMKILRKKKDAKGVEDDASAKQKSYPPCRYTFVKKRATNNRLLEPVEPDPPNASCAVCGQARLELVCDTESFTLGRLLHDVLKKKLGMHAPEINAPETVLYEHPEGLEEDEIAQYEKNLLAVLTATPAGGVRNGTELAITDYSQKFEFKLLVTHRPRSEWDEEEDPDLFILRGDQSAIGEAEEGDGAEAGGDAAAAGDDDDDFEIVDDGDELEIVESADAGTKRKRDASAEEGAEGAEKARRVE